MTHSVREELEYLPDNVDLRRMEPGYPDEKGAQVYLKRLQTRQPLKTLAVGFHFFPFWTLNIRVRPKLTVVKTYHEIGKSNRRGHGILRGLRR